MLRSDEQRRAFWWKMRKTQRRVFPMHAKTERSKRNRNLAIVVGGTAGLVGLNVATGGGKRTGPFRSILGTSGYRYPLRPEGGWPGRHSHVFHAGAGRKARQVEIATGNLLRTVAPRATRGIRRAMGLTSTRGIYRTLDPRTGQFMPVPGRRIGIAVTHSRGGTLYSGVVPVGKGRLPARGWEVWGTPVDARLKRRMWRGFERGVERTDLYKTLGGERLLRRIENASLRAQDLARRATRRLLTPAAEYVERPVAKMMTRRLVRPFGRMNVRLARKIRYAGRWLAWRAARRLA